MADKISKQLRSVLMSKIRSKGNLTTEMRMLKIMKDAGISGWRRHLSLLSFRPDFVFRKERVVVFVDGCFWHGCPLHGTMPKSNREFWKSKLEKNTQRDARAGRELSDSGWKVVRFWEHSVRNEPSECAERLKAVLDAACRKMFDRRGMCRSRPKPTR